MARTKRKKWLEMGRANRLAREAGAPASGHPPPKKKQKQTQQFNNSIATGTSTTTDAASKPAAQQQPNQAPTIPFEANDRILLVGEGDFSFARSCVEHHGAAALLATSYDGRETALEKYPQAAEHMAYIEGEAQVVLCGVDATKLGANKLVRRGLPADGYGWGGVEGMREGEGSWDRILFNFPHVGGKSTDVNRQVRFNQELLVSFFKSAMPLLSPTGTVIVTLFEGEPYTLWNLKDLARHVGLKVQRSFKFQASAYPGYQHARTLGNIEGGGGWKGENRPARSYIFEAPENKEDGRRGTNAPKAGKNKEQNKKRKKEDESSDDED